MPRYVRPYVDASVFLGWKNKEIRNGVNRYAVFQTIWEAAIRNEFKIYTSALTFAEVYKLRHQPNTQPLETVSALLDDFEKPFVEIIELDREIGIHANVLCRQFGPYKLYPNDSIHLASALRVPCDYLLCYDRPLSAVPITSIVVEEPIAMAAPLIQTAFNLALPVPPIQ